MNRVEVEKETATPVVEKKELYSEHKKFKSSPVISPVYGIEHPTSTNANDIELENTANYEKLDEEIRKTNEFLMTLKELQKKLDITCNYLNRELPCNHTHYSQVEGSSN